MSELTDFLLARIAEDERRWTNPALVRLTGPWLSDLVLKMRADVKARRAIVEARIRSDKSADDGEWAMGYSDGNYDALHALASVYADHPDYRDEWKP